MALPTYLTIEEADAILGSDAPWSGADNDAKQNALEMARAYVDANYKINFVEENSVPENVKYGNALIANEELISDIFTRQSDLGSLEQVTVKAGSTETTKRYTNKISKTWIDPFKKATAIMKPDCTLRSGSGIRYKSLIRG